MQNTKTCMTTNPITVRASETLLKAYSLMRERNIRHLPVMSERNEVIGILSDRDVQRAMNIYRSGYVQEAVIDPGILVEDFMSWPVYTVSEETSLKTVAKEMLSQKVSAFVVEDHLKRLKGIITTDDLLKYFVAKINQDDVPLKAITRFFTGPELY